jgi:hypothetical protein
MTNRERLQRAWRDIQIVSSDEAISPTPYSHLLGAIADLEAASQFVLDMNERDGVKVAR